MSEQPPTTPPATVPAHVMAQGVLAWQMLHHINADEIDQARSCLGLILMFGDLAGLYIVCEAWADLIATEIAQPGSTFAGLRFARADTGEPVEPGDLPADMAPAVWAGRFVAATINQDQETTQALYTSAVQARQLDAIEALAAMAAAVLREETG